MYRDLPTVVAVAGTCSAVRCILFSFFFERHAQFTFVVLFTGRWAGRWDGACAAPSGMESQKKKREKGRNERRKKRRGGKEKEAEAPTVARCVGASVETRNGKPSDPCAASRRPKCGWPSTHQGHTLSLSLWPPFTSRSRPPNQNVWFVQRLLDCRTWLFRGRCVCVCGPVTFDVFERPTRVTVHHLVRWRWCWLGFPFFHLFKITTLSWSGIAHYGGVLFFFCFASF